MLQVENLTKRLGRFSLRVDALTVPAGAYFLLLGPSGSGKTVLLETLAGLNRADEGRVTLDGRDITALPPERRGIGFVYQKAWLFPNLSVEDNIRFGLRAAGIDSIEADNRVARLAGLMGLGRLLDRMPRRLSGGESQRAAMARALAVRPRLLFLDEPLGPLDPAARETLAQELKTWHRQFGTTTLHVTHDHVEARMLADQVGVLLDGRLAQSGGPDEVFGRPAGERLARFVGCENIWHGQGVPDSASPAGPTVQIGGLALRVAGPARGPVAVSVRPEEVTLSDADGSAAENRFEGRLAEVSDRGPVLRLTAESAGVRFVAYETRADARRRDRRVGAPVTIAFAASAAHVMKR